MTWHTSCTVVLFATVYGTCFAVGILAVIPAYPFLHRELLTALPLCGAGVLGLAVTMLAGLDPTKMSWEEGLEMQICS
jgi:hypothetical protein